MTAPDPRIGRRLADRYRIEAAIARGGMARVYKARDERLEREVAVKILSSPYADDPDFRSRFLAEARAAASLSHPSLVHVYDSGSDGDAHFIVMELLDRHRSLRQVLQAQGPLPLDEVLDLGLELLEGLAAVHRRGLVHCDVKAANVMLGPGPAKLIDFGIARTPLQADDGDTSIGSLHSMSPEQLHAEPLSPASDIFSLGVVLYEALTGRMPYPGSTPDQVEAAQRANDPGPPSSFREGVTERLDGAILQALRRDASARFQSADAMRHAMELARREVDARQDDETRVIATPNSPAPGRGYVPPPAPPPHFATSRTRGAGVPSPVRPHRSGGAWRAAGTLLVLSAAVLVVALVVVPLLQLRGAGGGSPSPSAAVASEPGGNAILIPDTVGMSTDDAIDAARELRLDWTVRCAEDRSRPAGIIDQEPPPGTPVAPGSTFTMYSARVSDCR